MLELGTLHKKNRKSELFKGKIVSKSLLAFTLISVLVTFGILFTLLFDAMKFFNLVPITEIFSTELSPLGNNPSFGFLPILTSTILTSLIAILVAGAFGLSSAIYLSEFASKKTKLFVKPIIEVLAGIPTIVYGFFAYSFMTPFLMNLFPSLEAKNALSPGIVMGIMIIPLVASLSEDAMNSVPNSLREGAIGLGSTKLETTFKVIIPAAFSGIVASFVLAISRAIGETMILAIASGSSKSFTLDVTQSMQTMTGYIVEFISGDAGSGTAGYYSLYAVGLFLFGFTYIMNILAKFISNKFKENY